MADWEKKNPRNERMTAARMAPGKVSLPFTVWTPPAYRAYTK
jgi:hypothetical protein